MGKRINIRPTTGVYATYKNINYEIWTAIAEFVDNSTQSFYDNELKLENSKYWDKLNVHINYLPDNEGNYYLEIKDNAFGMDFGDFKRAIILDSKPTIATRSEFGMGLKTAACWFGLNWSIESTALGIPTKYKTEIDVEQLSKYKNEEIEVEEITCSPREHGTVIKIWKMNRSIAGRSIAKTKSMLASMYRVDIRTNKINIYYNEKLLEFTEPEVFTEHLPNHETIIWKKDISFELEYREKKYPVHGMIAIRKKANTTEAGLTLIRRGRVIIGGYEKNYRPHEIFGSSNSFEYQRLFGELHMDNWPVVQTKDNFDWNNGLEDDLVDELKKITKDYVNKAQKIRVRANTDVNDIIEKTAEVFEKTGIITNVEISDYKDNNSNTLEDINSSINGKSEVLNEFGSDDDNEVNFSNGVAKSLKFEIENIEYKFNLMIEKNDPDARWLVINENNNEYTIRWNVKHSFFKKFMDNTNFVLAMQKFIFALAISEVQATKINENGRIPGSSIRNNMNDILKIIGEEVI